MLLILFFVFVVVSFLVVFLGNDFYRMKCIVLSVIFINFVIFIVFWVSFNVNMFEGIY